jgi:hypothetical protein
MIRKDIAAKLTCIDIRTDYRKLDISKAWMYQWLIPKLREHVTIHMPYLHPVNITFLKGAVRDKGRVRELARIYFHINSISGFRGLPVYRYLYRMYFLGSGELMVLYYAPSDIRDEIEASLDDFFDEVERVDVYPVMNCRGLLFEDVKDNLEIDKIGHDSLMQLCTVPPYKSRNWFLDYMLIAALEHDPSLTIRELRLLTHAARARVEKELNEKIELNMRYVTRHYREMSRRFILGRMLVVRPDVCCYPLIEAEKSARELLYGLAATTLGSTLFIEGRDTVIASVAVSSIQELGKIMMLLGYSITKVNLVIQLKVAPFPFEMYNPLTGEWSLGRPVIEKIDKVVRKFRLDRRVGRR